MTLAEYESLPEVEGVRYELNEGRLIELPTPILLHNILRGTITRTFLDYLDGKGRQGLSVAIQAFQLGPDTVCIPDVAFIAADQTPDFDACIQRFAPALAVVIASPSDRIIEIARKTQQYLEAGTKTVWIAVLPAKEIHVYSASAHPRILCGDDVLEDPELFPGFSVRVADLFEV